MKNDPVPENDNISRYCSATHITEDGQITGTAFQLRSDEKYLSVNWLEFLGLNTREHEIKEIRKVLGKKLRLGSKAKFAVLNIKEMIDSVESKAGYRPQPKSRENHQHPKTLGIYIW